MFASVDRDAGWSTLWPGPPGTHLGLDLTWDKVEVRISMRGQARRERDHPQTVLFDVSESAV